MTSIIPAEHAEVFACLEDLEDAWIMYQESEGSDLYLVDRLAKAAEAVQFIPRHVKILIDVAAQQAERIRELESAVGQQVAKNKRLVNRVRHLTRSRRRWVMKAREVGYRGPDPEDPNGFDYAGVDDEPDKECGVWQMTNLDSEDHYEGKHCGLTEPHESHTWVDGVGGACLCTLPDGVSYALDTLVCRGRTLSLLEGRWQVKRFVGPDGCVWQDLDEHSGTGTPEDLFEIRPRPTMEMVRLDQVVGRKLAGRTWHVIGFDCYPGGTTGSLMYVARAEQGAYQYSGNNVFTVSSDGLVEVQPLEMGYPDWWTGADQT